MELHFSKIYPQKWVQIVILFFFCLFLYFFNLGQWDLWNPDEPRYAEAAREMVNGGDWVLMHFNGKIYEDKPPLFFWLIGLASSLFGGFSSFSVRFPSALFGTLTVLLTFFIGGSLYTSRTGFLSGLILATSLGVFRFSTRANMDTTLTFFTTASIFCFIEWYQNRPPHPSPLPQGERDRVRVDPLPPGEREWVSGRGWIYGFYVAMALATLTKGPVGFILPLLVSLIYLTFQRDWEAIRRMRLVRGILLLLVIALAWYLPAVLKGGQEYLRATLLHQSLDRFAEGTSHIRPFYFYFYNFPVDFLPWIFFLPGALAYGFSGEATGKRKEFLFLFVWFAVIFLFFSISKGKRGLYLLPLFPAVSIMVGKVWDDFVSGSMERFEREWISFSLYAMIGLALVGGAAVPWVVSVKFPSYLSHSLPMAFLMVGSSLALSVLNRFKHYGAVLFLIVGIMAGGYLYALRVVFPLVNPYKSARFISQEISARRGPSERLAIYENFGTGPYNYYTGIVPILEMENPEELFRFLESEDRVFCILKSRNLLRLQQTEAMPKVQLVAKRRVGDKEIVVISNR